MRCMCIYVVMYVHKKITKKKIRTCNLYIGRTKSFKNPPNNICNIMFFLFVYIFPSTLWNCWRASQNYVAFFIICIHTVLLLYFVFCFPFTTATVSNCSLLWKLLSGWFFVLLFIHLFVCLFPGWRLLHVWDYWGCGKNKYNFYWVMAHTSIEIFSILNNSIDFTKSFIYFSNKTWREQIKTHFHHWILYKFIVLV